MNLEEIANQIKAAPRREFQTKIIGIDGCGGAGKSTLAEALTKALPRSILIHTDDFSSWDTPVNWWPRLIEQVLAPLKNDHAGRYQRYDWNTRKLAEWHDVPVGGTVLIEGVTALRREFREAYAFGIYVSAPAELRLQRGLDRDGAQALPQWKDWMAAEDRYVADHKPQDVADLVIDGTDERLYSGQPSLKSL